MCWQGSMDDIMKNLAAFKAVKLKHETSTKEVLQAVHDGNIDKKAGATLLQQLDHA